MDDDEFADLLARPPAAPAAMGLLSNPWGGGDALEANPFADLSAPSPFAGPPSPLRASAAVDLPSSPDAPAFAFGAVAAPPSPGVAAPSPPAGSPPLGLADGAPAPLMPVEDEQEEKPLRQMMPKAKAPRPAAAKGQIVAKAPPSPTPAAPAQAPVEEAPESAKEAQESVEPAAVAEERVPPAEDFAIPSTSAGPVDAETPTDKENETKGSEASVQDAREAPAAKLDSAGEQLGSRPEAEQRSTTPDHALRPGSSEPAEAGTANGFASSAKEVVTVSDALPAAEPTGADVAAEAEEAPKPAPADVEESMSPAHKTGNVVSVNGSVSEATSSEKTSTSAEKPQEDASKSEPQQIPANATQPAAVKPATGFRKAASVAPGLGSQSAAPAFRSQPSISVATPKVFDPLGANNAEAPPSKPTPLSSNGVAPAAANPLGTAPATSAPRVVPPGLGKPTTAVAKQPAPTALDRKQPLIPASAFGNVANPLAPARPSVSGQNEAPAPEPPGAPKPAVPTPPVTASPVPEPPAAAKAAQVAAVAPDPAPSDPLAASAPQEAPEKVAVAPIFPTPAQEPVASRATAAQSTTSSSPTAVAVEAPKPLLVLPKFEISVGEPSRVGGLDAHTSYRIRTKTTSPKFRNPEVSVNRRYRDFLWLFNQLSIGHPGVIIPPLPEKQTMGRFQEEFVESRRVGLERFLQKITSHPMLFDDADVKVFLESETFSADSSMLTKRDPSKATGGILGAFSMSNVTQFRATPDRDDFLDTRKMEIDKFEAQLKQLMKGVEAIVKQRKELGAATSEFGDALLALSGAESDQALSTKLKNLGNVSRRIKDLHDKQAQNDVSSLAYMVEEYIRFCGAVEMAYQSRTRYWNLVKNAEGNVMNKRLALDKARAAGKKGDKLTSIQTEIDEAEVALKQAQKEFAEVSAKLRQELERFDRERVVDLAKSLQEFLESLLFTQKEIVVTWESYYAETRQP